MLYSQGLGLTTFCRLYKAVTSCQKEVQDFLTPSSATVPEGTNAHDSDIKIWDYVIDF